MVRTITRQVVDLQPDLSLTVLRTGAGRAVLVLHGGGGPDSITTIVDRYADRHDVLAPVHPGWAGTAQPAPRSTPSRSKPPPAWGIPTRGGPAATA